MTANTQTRGKFILAGKYPMQIVDIYQCFDGQMEKTGWVNAEMVIEGLVGIYQVHGERWTAMHIPTGCAIVKNIDRRWAIEVAMVFEELSSAFYRDSSDMLQVRIGIPKLFGEWLKHLKYSPGPMTWQEFDQRTRGDRDVLVWSAEDTKPTRADSKPA